jgi:uncharacterized LabA/DUF88 family protein
MPNYFPAGLRPPARVMMFVDGENLAIRYGKMLERSSEPQQTHVVFERNVFVWTHCANAANHVCEVVRRHYYTSVQGDDLRVSTVADRLRDLGIEAPRVFKKTKGKGSKRVDIALATDMLTHAHRGNYDLAVLVAGDEDYVPLVEAVMSEGRRVALWFVESGLSPELRRTADYFFDFGEFLFKPRKLIERIYGAA